MKVVALSTIIEILLVIRVISFITDRVEVDDEKLCEPTKIRKGHLPMCFKDYKRCFLAVVGLHI